MAIKRISKDTEAKIMAHLEKVADLISTGSTPNDAIIKVAKDGDVEHGHVQMMIHAYNNAKTNKQRQSSTDLVEKTAKFDLADPKVIFNSLYPAQEKVAADAASDYLSDEYSFRPDTVIEKHASGAAIILEKLKLTDAPLHEEDYYVKRACSLLNEINNTRDGKRLEIMACEQKAAAAYEALQTYFRQPLHTVSFKEAAANSTAMYGTPAKRLFETLADDLPAFAKKGSATLGRMDKRSEPYKYVEVCLDEIEKRGHLKAALDTFCKDAAAISSKVLNHFIPTQKQPFTGSLTQARGHQTLKQADFIEYVTNSIRDLMSGSPVEAVTLGATGKPDSKLKTDAYLAVTDPAHEATMRAIRSQAMLKRLMDEDDFLQGEDPKKVTDLFNQIVKVSPRVADQPLAIKGLLRRYIAQGQVDPHDVSQLADIETKMKQRDEPQREFHMPKLVDDFTRTTPSKPNPD